MRLGLHLRRRHLGTQRLSPAVPVAARALDVAIVIALLPVAVPLAALIAIAILIDSPGPVLYKASRVGRDGRMFAMLKFRTMVRDAGGEPLRAAGDDRETPLGALLSRSRLNELPQLVNVLRGDMRLVGPRPEVAEFARLYPAEFAEILTVAPGLTGTSQLARLDEPAVLAAVGPGDRAALYVRDLLPAKLDADLRYVRGRTATTDLRLLVMTSLAPLAAGRRSPAPDEERARPAAVLLALALVAVYVVVGRLG